MIINMCGGDNSAIVKEKVRDLINGTTNLKTLSFTAQDLEGITMLRAHIFDGINLSSLELPNTLKTIKEYAFNFTQFLNKLVIPDSVTKIENNGLVHLPDLQSLTIGTGITAITTGMISSGYMPITTLILRNNTTTAKTLNSTSALPSEIQHIYIQAVGSVNVTTLVNNYKKATNWSSLSSKISAYTG